MRDWKKEFPTFEALANWYINDLSPNNFLLIATYSVFMRRYAGAYRYTCNGEATKATVYGSGPSWSNYTFHPCYNGKLYISGKQLYGVWHPSAPEFFEYTDKVAGIGYAHLIRKEFTGEETLLCRAEAYVHLNRTEEALADLKIWDKARQNLPTSNNQFTELDSVAIVKFYSNSSNSNNAPVLNTSLMDPSWTIPTEYQKMLLYCVLHFRRLETIFEGPRWFDIKRYGIEIEHKIGQSRVETLRWDDPRRALQLPAEVIAAGLVKNERVQFTTPTPEPILYNGVNTKK
jgi:hypothetical protein